MKLITVNEIEDLRNNIGFHFTPSGNAKFISEGGLKPLTGDLSSGNLGKEAIDNVFFSYGLEGVLQLYNNLLYFSHKAYSIHDLQTNTFAPFMPYTNHTPLEHLSMLEGFELVRQYMENNQYIVFEAKETKYSERDLTGEEIEKINQTLKTLKSKVDDDQPIYDQIKILDKKISEENHKPLSLRNVDLIEQYQAQRNSLAIQLYNKSREIVDDIRGSETDSGTFDRCDFDFGKLEWHTQVVDKNDKTALPHNAHTKIVEENGNLIGSSINSNDLYLLSIDGIKAANGIEVLQALYSKTTLNDNLTIDNRPMLLGLFLEYIKLVDMYKNNPSTSGLLIKKEPSQYIVAGVESIVPERVSLDMTMMQNYPGLIEFEEKLNEYIRNHKQNKTTIQALTIHAIQSGIGQEEVNRY